MLIKLSKAIIFTSSIALIPFLSSCGDIGNEGKNSVGKTQLLSAEIIEEISSETMTGMLNALGTPHGDFVFGYKAIRIKYKTTDEKDQSVNTSGLLVLPVTTPEFLAGYKAINNIDYSLSLISDQHGTIFTKNEAPSSIEIKNGQPDSELATLFSSIYGFATLMPDYIGYGSEDEHYHPFILEKSSANSTVDLIKATISYLNENSLPFNGQIFLSGYSEGGYTTMAAAKEIELNQKNLKLKAVAPMAGPYDLETIGMGALSSETMSFPPFLAYIAYSYAKTYDDIDINQLIQPTYTPLLDTLFDRNHTTMEIYGALPNSVVGTGQETEKLFLETFMDDFLGNSQNSVRTRFVENSPLDWKPITKMRLYHCDNDEIIPYIMSENAYARFTENGSTSVELMPTHDFNATQSVHSECAPTIYPQVAAWFDSIRKGE